MNTRSRKITSIIVRKGSSPSQNTPVITFPVAEQITQTRVAKGRSNVSHTKALATANGYLGIVNNVTHSLVTYLPSSVSGSYPPDFSKVISTLEQKMLSTFLPETSDFELLPFISEWDETVKFFAESFVKQVVNIASGKPRGSYGSLTWGLAPLVSDLKGLVTSLRALSKGIPQPRPVTTISSSRPLFYYNDWIPSSVHPNGDTVRYIDGVCRIKGELVTNLTVPEKGFDKAFALLDALGVHPDLKTAWDVLPFSFVVDYFFPIGKFLDSLHPRGWLFSSTFQGSVSSRYIVEGAYTYVQGGKNIFQYVPWKIRVYNRRYILSPLPPKPIVFDSPTFMEIFNTVYLFSSLNRSI